MSPVLPAFSRRAAVLSAAAYFDPPELNVEVWLYGENPDEVRFLTAGDTQAFIARFGAVAWLVFRGTECDFGDILTDLKFRREALTMVSDKIPGPVRAELRAASVHRGFLEGWLLIRDQVIAALLDMRRRHPALQINLAGHSLGAALALIAAPDLAGRAIGGQGTLHLFGCPRTGDADFSAFAAAGHDIIRYVNCCDIVPRVPFWSLGYRHAGRLVYFDRHGRPHDNPSIPFRLADMANAYLVGAALRLADGLDWSDALWLLRSRAFTDHRVNNYVRLSGSG